MTMKLYVGNLAADTTETELTELFTKAGEIENVRIVRHQNTGRSKGFAFVRMINGGDKAILDFNGNAFNGRPLTVVNAQRALYVVAPVSIKDFTDRVH